MAKNNYDQHLHTSFSYDGEKGHTVSRVCETAITKNLAGIAITDHFDPLWPDDEFPSTIDLPSYEKALTEAEEIYGDRIAFAKGIELGFIPGEALEMCEDVVSNYPYDFVLGSVHSSEVVPVDFPVFHEGRTLDEILGEYYALLLNSIRAYKNYDVLGHINYIDRYTNGFAPEKIYMPYVDEILKLAISDGKGIEISTSSYRYGIEDHGTPTPAILKRFKELGGEIITIGSDAHTTADIGGYIEKGEEMLLALGFRYVAVFKNRRAEFLPL